MDDNGSRHHDERRGGHSVEDEDEGAHAVVEGCLGDDEHAGADKLYDKSDQVWLLRPHLHGLDSQISIDWKTTAYV